MSDLKDQLIRTLKSPRITFQNGMMDKPNNNVNGFVSDLTNMEITDDGVAQRRKGSFCLYNPLTAKEFYLFAPTKISGCDVVFFLDYNGRIYCSSENYPEILFTLNKSGFTKIYYADNNEFSYESRFERGTKFFFEDRPDSLTFMNDFGDTITINKKGSIRFLGSSNVQESYNTATRMYVDSYPTDAGVFVNLVYSRKNNLSSFYLVKADKKSYDHLRKHIPRINSIRGEVKVAQADNMGRVGRLTQSIFLSKYGEFYVSVIPAFAANGTLSNKVGIKNFGDDKKMSDYTLDKFNRFFIEREASDNNLIYQLITSFGSNADVTFTSSQAGVTIAYVQSGSPIPVDNSVVVVDKAISVVYYYSHPTHPHPTANNVVSLINDSIDALALVNAVAAPGDGTGDIGAMAATPLVSFGDYDYFSIDAEDNEYNLQSNPYLVDGKKPSYRTCIFAIHPDAEETPSGNFIKATMWMDYQFGAATKRQVAFYNVGCLMRAIKVKFLRIPRSGTALVADQKIILSSGGNVNKFIATGDVETITVTEGAFPTQDYDEVPMYITKARYCADLPYKYDETAPSDDTSFGDYYSLRTESATASSGILFEVMIGLPANLIKDNRRIIDIQDKDGNVIASDVRTYGLRDLFIADIPFVLDGLGDPEGFYPAQWLHDFPNNESTYVGLRNIGYDCWQAKRGLKVSTSMIANFDYYDVDILGNIYQKPENTSLINDELYKNYDLLCDENEYIKWFKSGSRFVVWNEGNVIAVSQKCFANTEDLVPIYSKEYTDPNDRHVNYQTEIDMIGYLPVCAIENIYLRSFQYTPPALQKDIQFIKSIAENGGFVFMVENGVVWIGTNIEMLLFNYKATTNDSVELVCRFDQGVVAFSKDNICYIDPKGNVQPVHNLAAFKNVTALKAKYLPDGSVYGITSSGELFRISIQYTENNNKYYQAENISFNISETVFDSSTDIAFSNNTVWFSRDSDVYGLTRRGWTRKYTFGSNKISGIFTYKDQLCVAFYNEPFRLGRIVPPEIDSITFTG